MIQTIEVPMELPAGANQRGHWKRGWSRGQGQQHAATWALQANCARPLPPCTVTLVRVASHRLDDDNLPNCFKAVRDAVALWVHALPLRVLGKNGKPRMPRAPDGPNDGITWRYDQDQRPGKLQAARIIIEGELATVELPLSVPDLAKAARKAAEACA
jgi:hypothetical protein